MPTHLDANTTAMTKMEARTARAETSPGLSVSLQCSSSNPQGGSTGGTRPMGHRILGAIGPGTKSWMEEMICV